MKIMSFIRRYACTFALLSILMAAIAAPYMLPVNPDSMVFRSGTLGLILLMGCFLPVREAFERAQKRSLLTSMIFGYLFALALSLGSELYIYNGLLRGLGSLIRRMAVPVLASPLLGGLCCRLTLSSPLKKGDHTWHIPVWGYALVIFLCWLPLLLAYFPGMLNYDFPGQYGQHLESSYSSAHPLLHSYFCNSIITLGESLHSRTFGVLLYILIQMSVFSLSLGYSCAFVQRRGAPSIVPLIMTSLYALHPVFSVMALSMTKDTLFSSAILMVSLLTWKIIESPQSFFKSKGTCVLYVFCVINTALMRNNGVFALALLFPSLLFLLRGFRKPVFALSCVCVAACLLTNGVLTLALKPEKLPSFQFYSIPAQQLIRGYNSGRMTEAEKAEIEEWYVDPAGLVVHPHLADGAKGYLDRPRIQAEGSQFISIWAKHAKDYAHEYLEAFLMLNVGSWYPDDLSHSTIYPDASWNDKGYLQTQEYDMTAFDIHTTSFLPKLKNAFERICRRNEYQEYPIISVLFCTATPFWVLTLAIFILIAKGHSTYSSALLGCMGLWLSYLFGPCTLPRYILPLFCLAPAALFLALCLPCHTRKE